MRTAELPAPPTQALTSFTLSGKPVKALGFIVLTLTGPACLAALRKVNHALWHCLQAVGPGLLRPQALQIPADRVSVHPLQTSLTQTML